MMRSKKPEAARVVLHIFRHGERPIESVSAGALTKRGKGQGTSTGITLANELSRNKKKKIVKFYTSDVKRNIEFTDAIRNSLYNQVKSRKLDVELLRTRVRNKFKYGEPRDKEKYDRLYGHLSLVEFDKLWASGKTDPKVVEQPQEVLERIRRSAEEFGSRVSRRYRGQPVEVHVVVVTHGDLMDVLRRHIDRKQPIGRKLTRFGERIKINLKGKKGVYHTRGHKRGFCAMRKRK